MNETRLKRARYAIADCEREIAEIKLRLEDLYGLLWNARAEERDALAAAVREVAAAETEKGEGHD